VENSETRLIGKSLEEPCDLFHGRPRVPVEGSAPYRGKKAIAMFTMAYKPIGHRV
jgi:hypothetical protein